jgi:hypothetical protein
MPPRSSSAHLSHGAGFAWLRTLVLNIALAQPPGQEYAELVRGRDDDEPVALADSFAFASCGVRETRDQLACR